MGGSKDIFVFGFMTLCIIHFWKTYDLWEAMVDILWRWTVIRVPLGGHKGSLRVIKSHYWVIRAYIAQKTPCIIHFWKANDLWEAMVGIIWRWTVIRVQLGGHKGSLRVIKSHYRVIRAYIAQKTPCIIYFWIDYDFWNDMVGIIWRWSVIRVQLRGH